MAVFSGGIADGGLLDGNTRICLGVWSVSPELWGQDLSPQLCLLLLLLLLLLFLQKPCGVGIINVSLAKVTKTQRDEVIFPRP